MDIHRTLLAGIPLLEIQGDVDHYAAADFDAAVMDALDDQRGILLDLSECDYLDSGGLAAVISALRRLGPDQRVGVIGCSKHVLRLFEIIGLTSDPAFQVFADRSEATEASGVGSQ
jgi:anti-anti-sigma factor